MKKYLYTVGMKDKRTGEKINLRIWAANTDEATGKVTGALFGMYGEYVWTGSGPVYEDNKLFEREEKE